MRYTALRQSGVAFITVYLAPLDGRKMVETNFLVDTGATNTTLPKYYLMEKLGYTEEYIENNKIILNDNQKPTMANSKKIDVYRIPITRMNIGGYELKHDYILTSDTINLNFLLGLDILKYFRFTYDFDLTDNETPHGKMTYELREIQKTDFKGLDKPFIHVLE